MEIEKQVVLDLLQRDDPKLSATSDLPVVETKPDSTPAPVVPAAEEKTEVKTDSAPVETTTEDSSATPDEAKKPAKGVQKRIDELTRQREDEKRRAEAAEARLDRALGALEKGTTRELPPNTEDTEPVKPLKTAFDNPEAYDEAMETYIIDKSSYAVRREVKTQMEAQAKKTADEALTRRNKEAQDVFLKRVEKTKEKYSDYSQVAESPDVQVSFPMAYAILNSEQGPEIQYYLGKNPEEAKRISAMTTTDQGGQSVPDVARQLVELGMITAKISTPAVLSKPVSAAPAPIKPISKASEEAKNPEEMTMEEYAAYRKPQLNKRPGARH